MRVISSAIVNKTSNNPYSGPLTSQGPGYGHLEAIWGPVWGGVLEGQFEVILGPILDPILGNLMETSDIPSFGRG